ncbi:MAG: SPFH domain-containing protein [Dehalococcoidia bacterium]|jgi:hypothetical protein|nr:SPFH domain-containing protein [Dehalococcoidia bacterium]
MQETRIPSAPTGDGTTFSEKQGWALAGVLGILVALIAFGLIALGAALIAMEIIHWGWSVAIIIPSAVFLVPIGVTAHYLVQPNQSLVITLFGRYRGTINEPGWYWTPNPFTKIESKLISKRVHNFTTATTKVNDAEGNPIEIAAVVVWRVVDTARAVFQVSDYQDFVEVQSETAIRSLGTQYPYDDFEGHSTSLRANPDEVAHTLHQEVSKRLSIAGVEVVEARLTHLAYATEIAEAMLRRQQASAIISARSRIVQGAVGMVKMALEELSEQGIVDLDEERKATMVSNLLVVLTSDQSTTPVVNAGSIY